MIYYRPTDGGPDAEPINWRPRTAFVMQQFREPLPVPLLSTRKVVDSVLKKYGFSTVDSDSETTGGDYLIKIWRLAIACPLGIAIVQEGLPAATLANIFYEIGMMQAYGRETMVVCVGEPDLPSDLVRTEYLKADAKLKTRLGSLMKNIAKRASSYDTLAEQLENDPLLSIDFLRRAYMLSGRDELRGRAREIFDAAGLTSRAGTSLENNMVRF